MKHCLLIIALFVSTLSFANDEVQALEGAIDWLKTNHFEASLGEELVKYGKQFPQKWVVHDDQNLITIQFAIKTFVVDTYAHFSNQIGKDVREGKSTELFKELVTHRQGLEILDRGLAEWLNEKLSYNASMIDNFNLNEVRDLCMMLPASPLQNHQPYKAENLEKLKDFFTKNPAFDGHFKCVVKTISESLLTAAFNEYPYSRTQVNTNFGKNSQLTTQILVRATPVIIKKDIKLNKLLGQVIINFLERKIWRQSKYYQGYWVYDNGLCSKLNAKEAKNKVKIVDAFESLTGSHDDFDTILKAAIAEPYHLFMDQQTWGQSFYNFNEKVSNYLMYDMSILGRLHGKIYK